MESTELQEPEHVFTSADRIRQLNDIDKDVAKLLQSAGVAIQALTNRAPKTDSTSAFSDSLESHRSTFKTATQQYFALLSSIDVRLRRQVYALEEASIIPPESSSKAAEAAAASGGGSTTATSTANPFEISWLNSRKDTVGKDKEAELWAEARAFVEKVAEQRAGGGQEDNPAGDRDMELD